MTRAVPLRRLLGLALTFALALAIPAAGAAHRLASGAPEQQALALYVAMGGKLADLCGAGDLGSLAHCDACNPLGPALPPAPPLVGPAGVPAPQVTAPAAHLVPVIASAGPAPGRGPPGAVPA